MQRKTERMVIDMKRLMLGNEAIARGAYEAGITVVSSYPGTPSTEITEHIAKYHEIYAEWATNEKVAAEVAIGASIAGARSMTCMKHVGLNVAADPVFTASYTGVNGALVIVVADDPGMHSSQNEQDSRNYAKGAKLPMLEPANSSECKEFVKLACEMSESFDTPVLLRLTTRISHSQSLVEEKERESIDLKAYTKDIGKYVMMPAMARARHIVVEDRMEALSKEANSMKINTIEYNDKKIGIITAGVAYQYAKEALPEASILKLGMVYPMPTELLREFAENVEQVYVIEELDPFMEDYCKSIGLAVQGKNLFSLLGEYSAQLIEEKILGKKPEISAPMQVPMRPPVMCPGCPHRGVFTVLSKLKVAVSGDIGCYTLGATAPLHAMDACVCMGASISMVHGMEKARGSAFAEQAVAVIGDSTFMHSGVTGLIDIVYNKGTSTVIILDNSITGMTGHQHNPTTGYTLKNEATAQVDLEMLCRAVGVQRVVVSDPFDMTGFEKTLKEEMQVREPSVIIARRPCALLKSVDYGKPYKIIEDKCLGCKGCMKIACSAISYHGETKKCSIDNALCCGCGLCLTCAFEAIVREDT